MWHTLLHSLAQGQLKDIGCNTRWAGGSVLSVTELSAFPLAVPQEEMQAGLLLSGFWQIRKPLVLCMPKPSAGQHLHSTAFSQEGSALRELFSVLFSLCTPASTRDHPYCSNFGTGNIKNLIRLQQLLMQHQTEKQQWLGWPLLLEVFSPLR